MSDAPSRRKRFLERYELVIDRAIKRFGITAAFGFAYVLLWMWWSSTSETFASPLSSIPLGDLIYGLVSRAMIISAALGGVVLFKLAWSGQ